MKKFTFFLLLIFFLYSIPKNFAQCVESDGPQWNPLPASSSTGGSVNYPTTAIVATISISNGGATTFANTQNALNIANFSKSASGVVVATFSAPLTKSTTTESFKIFNLSTSEGQVVTATNVNDVTVYPTFVNLDKVVISGVNNNEITGNTFGLSGAGEFSFSVPIKSLTIGPKTGVTATTSLNINFQKACETSTTPIELTNFTAKTQNGHVKIYWQTAYEKNNKGFEIQRSSDAKTWDNIGELKGQGESNVITDYAFMDASPLSILTYYRLKQIDFDGKFAFSNTVSVSPNKKNVSFGVYPNPIENKEAIITIDEDLLEGTLTVINSIGLVVKKEKIKSKNLTLDLDNWTTGIYIFNIQKDGIFQSKKVMIAE